MIEISLKNVYSTLDKVAPEISPLIAKIIRKIKIIETEDPLAVYFKTLGIDYTGTLYVYRDFWDKYLTDVNSLGVLLLHELYHDVTGDTYLLKRMMQSLDLKNLSPEEQHDLELRKTAYNLAMDCRINASVYLTSNLPNPGKIFKDFYTEEVIKENPILSIVTPYGREHIPDQDLKNEYDAIYGRSNNEICTFKEMYELVYAYLKENSPPPASLQQILDMLFGDHDEGDPNNPSQKFDNLPQELKDKIEEALMDHLQMHKDQNEASKKELPAKTPKQAGQSRNATEVIIGEHTGVDQKFNLSYFKVMSFNSIMNNVRLEMDSQANFSEKSLLIPNKISRSDIFRLMRGEIPMSWDTFSWRPVKTNRKIPIYLDVSGSMHSELPAICQLLINVKDDIEYVWGFSNEVHRHEMEDLKKGKLNTTGGTDFDCIIDHAIENGFRNLLVITDGYADCRQPNGAKLDELDSVTVVLCTSSRSEENYFCKTYETTVQIEDVTTQHV